MKKHELKLHTKYFNDVKYGIKKFEVRINDRGFELGDVLILREWDGEEYTGWEVVKIVTYIIDLKEIGLEGWVAMGID